MAAATGGLTPEQIIAVDGAHLWHPYSSIGREAVSPVVAVAAHGAWLTLIRDGQPIEVLDAMSSWWTAIHGHGHPALDQALTTQLRVMNHVMFGGLTHEPAARLAKLLVDITPAGLDTVFFSDSGSVSVEVAAKMALQYWRGRGLPGKRRLMTWRGGYHGDTFLAMSICDPHGGMHSLWTDVLAAQVFAPQVPRDYDPAYSAAFEAQLAQHAGELAAVVVEPVVQGAGGMRFHDPRYLHDLRDICRRYEVLLIFDEIATGFGRTGALFAADHAGVSPDIMCVGKALTGGYLSLAATLCTADVAHTISAGAAGALMHGPHLHGQSAGRRALPAVTDVRVCGAIGVIECDRPVDLAVATPAALDRGVWLRPFRNLVYAMPPYICTPAEITQITSAMVEVARLVGSLP